MSHFLGQIFLFLTAPPGNLIYHIVLVFAIAGALQGAIQAVRFSNFPQGRRTVIGLIILLGLQLVPFIISALTWRGLVNAQWILPPLDRAVTLLMLIWIAWLWVFPEPSRLGDAATLLLSLLALTALGLTLIFWALKPSGSFNLSGYESGWQILSMAIGLLGILGLILRRPGGWSYGLAILILGVLGHLAGLVYPVDGHFPGFVRMAQLGMFPILLALPQRFSSPTRPAAVPAKPGKPAEPAQERQLYSTDPKTFHALVSLAAETEPGKIGQAMTRGIAQAMLADLCFLITRGKDKSLAIDSGYNLVREENVAGMHLDQDAIPLLSNAIQHGRPLRLPASSNSSDLKSLGRILGLNNPGNLLSVPIHSPASGVLGSLLLLSPYSGRLWRTEDQTYLTSVTALLAPILERGQHRVAQDDERERSAREAQKQIEQLKVENERLRLRNGKPGANAKQMEKELNQTLEEMASIQNALTDANTKLQELENRPAAQINTEHTEIITSISQEMRQPMSSIASYTDLLMGESVGILGALQRKFVERIQVSTERIAGLVDNLIQAVNPEDGRKGARPEPVNLNQIIDNAMAYTSGQIRGKNITLRLDIPGKTQHIRTDREALQQILILLLQNATAATKTEGNISLRVQMQGMEDNQFLSIQVTDHGGGIASENIPRVFESRSKAGHVLIKGLGDTGTGLSTVKSLVDAQKGRIWVDSEAGSGSTFNVLLPVEAELPAEKKA